MNPKDLVTVHPKKKNMTVMGIYFDLKKSPPEQNLIEQARAEAQRIVQEYQLKTLIWILFPVIGIVLSLWLKEYYGLFAVPPCLYAFFICCDYSDKMQHALGLRALLTARKGPPHPTLAEVILKDGKIQDYFFNINGRKPVFAEEELLMMEIREEEK